MTSGSAALSRVGSASLGGRHGRFGDAALPYLLMGPALLLLCGLTLFPLLYSLILSFFDARLGHGLGHFVGLANYVAVLGEARFWNAFFNTAIWVVGSLVSQIVLGVLLAVLLNQLLFGRLFFRAALFFPWVMPVAVIAFLWRWIYNPQNGIVNVTLRQLNLLGADLPMWLADPSSAMGSALVVSAWRGIPFVLVMVLAALQGIPKEEYEAARVSGAGSIREFWYVTLPNLRTILLTIVLLRTMQVANNFSLMYLLTGGGPAEATEILPILIYIKSFGAHDLGQASALAVILLLVLLGFALTYARMLRER